MYRNRRGRRAAPSTGSFQVYDIAIARALQLLLLPAASADSPPALRTRPCRPAAAGPGRGKVMPFSTVATTLLGIEHPIVCGGMTATGSTQPLTRRSFLNSAAPPSPCGMCINRDGEGEFSGMTELSSTARQRGARRRGVERWRPGHADGVMTPLYRPFSSLSPNQMALVTSIAMWGMALITSDELLPLRRRQQPG